MGKNPKKQDKASFFFTFPAIITLLNGIVVELISSYNTTLDTMLHGLAQPVHNSLYRGQASLGGSMWPAHVECENRCPLSCKPAINYHYEGGKVKNSPHILKVPTNLP